MQNIPQLLPTNLTRFARLQILYRIRQVFNITYTEISACGNVNEFRVLLKQRYYSEMLQWHPDMNMIKYTYRDKERYNSRQGAYVQAMQINQADFVAIQHNVTINDRELPFAYSWDREPKIPNGYQLDHTQMQYK